MSKVQSVFISVLGILLCLWVSGRWGPGSSPDSASYAMAAQAFAQGLPPVQVDGQPFSAWPPLFPLLLSVGKKVGFSTVEAGRLLNALCFGGVLYAVLRSAGHRAAGLLAVALLVGMGGMWRVFSTLWSEPLMILCFLGAVQRRERPLQAGLLIGAAMLARHVGVVGLGAIGLWWLLRWELPLRQRVAAVGWLGLGALPGPGLWWLYLRVAGTPDVREDTRVGVLENARDFFTSLGQNVLNVDPAWPDLGLGLGLGVWVGALALVLSRVERGRATEVEEVVGIFVLLYPPFVIMASSMTVVAILGARFVNPLLPPLALMLGAGLASLSRPKGVALLLVPLWLSAAVKVQNYREQGLGGISTPVFQEAVLLEKIKEVRDEELWSNRPDLLALLWDRPVRLAAQKHPFRRPHQDAGGLRSLEGALQRGPVYMVWFNQSPGRDWYFYSPEQLGRAGYGVELLAEAEEGSLVLLSPAWLSEIREGEE